MQCNKVPYATKREARDDAKKIVHQRKHASRRSNRMSAKHGKKLREYKCAACEFYHLTTTIRKAGNVSYLTVKDREVLGLLKHDRSVILAKSREALNCRDKAIQKMLKHKNIRCFEVYPVGGGRPEKVYFIPPEGDSETHAVSIESRSFKAPFVVVTHEFIGGSS